MHECAHVRACMNARVHVNRCPDPLEEEPKSLEDGSACFMPDFTKSCKTASISIGGSQLKGSTSTIGENAVMLTVGTSAARSNLNRSGWSVRSLPLRGKEEGTVDDDGKATLPIRSTGNFVIELMQNGSSLCTLIPELTIKCAAGYSARGNTCERSLDTVNTMLFLGIGCSVLFIVCLLSMLVRV